MKFQEIDQTSLVNDYKNGITLREIAVKHQVSELSVLNWLKKLGIPRRGHRHEKKIHNPKELVKLYKQGLDCPDIAKRYNVCSDTIRKELIKAGCKIRPIGSHLLTDKNPTKGKGHTLETKQKLREANKRQFAHPEARARHAEITAKQIAQGKTGVTRNKLEKKVEKILVAEGHKFIPQHRTGKYVWDFYIPINNTLVEAHGTFWHADPRVWTADKLYPVQKKKILRDKERSEWAKTNGYNLRTIWELDI